MATRGGSAQPHLLRQTKDNVSGDIEDTSIQHLAPIQLRNSRHWRSIQSAMEAVVHGPTGTAKRIAENAPYRIAGKTGTAQVAGLSQEDDEAPQLSDVPEHLRDHSLFMGYAPADAPKVAVVVIAEHSGSGSAVAAPAARTILDHALGYPHQQVDTP